ncbi:hypothetical protein SAMN05192579_105166 [Rhodanobacter glycinis]|jgi:hypothetical protein|uniref:Sel1 repeat family protein n=2 Tax=Rhodanobacter glycinis TaxID=582702 RepID=A0A1I4BLL7_9GAMM|nr:hypothetical protein SAMN05192579_105166 [Rhodanobacter glycinis]
MRQSILLAATMCLLLPATAIPAHADPADTTSPPAPIAHAGSVPPPRVTPKLQGVLDAMDHASTWGHPDLFGQFAGMRNLFAGNYAKALKYFKYGARYADKLSQLSIGMMYMNGRGVARDPVMACAWMTLASERHYPTFVRARDAVCNSLSGAQADAARTQLEALSRTYGDAIAKPRMKQALLDARRGVTGSHTGFDFGIRTVAATPLDRPNCNGISLFLGGMEVPREGCGTYDPALLDPRNYFAARDAQWYGTVTIGTLQKTSAPALHAPASGTPHADSSR